MISHKDKFIFCHIPKTAGTSIERHLNARDDIDTDWVTFAAPGHPAAEGNAYINRDPNRCLGPVTPSLRAYTRHATMKQIKKQFVIEGRDLDQYFKFTVIRNPWDRIISHWHTKPGIRELSFRHYIDNIALKRADQCFDFLFDNENPLYDYTIRFENLQKDFNHVCDVIGIQQSVLPHENKRDRKPYQEYYNEETKNIVSEAFKKEIEYFRYEFDD